MESAPEIEEASQSSSATPSTSPRGSIAKRTHPKISTMVNKAIRVMKIRGDLLSEVKQYIALVYKVDTEKFEPAIAKYLKKAVASGYFTKPKKHKSPAVAQVLKQKHNTEAGSSLSSSIQTTMENQNNTCNEDNTQLAKAYFKKNNYQFPNKSEQECVDESDKDGYSNTIFYEGHPADLSNQCLRKLDTNFITVLEGKLRKLVEVIEKNTETFCQIEFLVRKIPMEEVREYDIKLIVQYLRCFTIERIRWEFNDVYGDRIYMNAGTPLANLGYVAQLLVRNKDDVVIVSTKDTAAVCQFFVDLCHSVGLDTVLTVCVKSLETVDITVNNVDMVPALNTGCVGVVTERCDVAAAADAFLRSSPRYPWKLSCIFVHETVYDEFNRAMAQCVARCQPAAARECERDGETFAHSSLVQSYRAADELVALDDVWCVSLWSDDVARANQLAHAGAARLVWVNCYAVFDGPPQLSLAIYTEMTLAGSDCPKTVPIVCSRESLLKKQENWEKTSLEERCRTVQDITDDFFSKFECDDFFLFDSLKRMHTNLIPALGEVRANDYFRVDDGRTCAVRSVPMKVLYRSNADVDDMLCTGIVTITGAGELARLLTNGSALIFQLSTDLFDYLKRLATKLPITWHPRHYGEKLRGKKVGKAHGQVAAYHSVTNRTKVIWTQFGK